MNQLNESNDRKDPNCILQILREDSEICIQKEKCSRHYECQPRDALRVVLDIPKRFSKAILILMDMQAEIYQYLYYIDAKEEGFNKAQRTAMLNHYGALEGPGKARSVGERGVIRKVFDKLANNIKYQTKGDDILTELNFMESDDPAIRDAFETENAVATPIHYGSDIVPLLILFLKNKGPAEEDAATIFLEDELRSLKIRFIMKDTRKESLGKIVSSIPHGDKPENDPRGKFSRWLLAWWEEHDGLWLGNKLWFVVDHGFIHAKNLWKLANNLAKEAGLGEKLKTLTNDEMSPLIFSLAIWLHDIGYKGIHLPKWQMILMDTDLAHIIDAHCIISAALILDQYESYNLNEFSKKIRACVSFICAYHQKGYPITPNDSKDDFVPEDLKICNNKDSFLTKVIEESEVIKCSGENNEHLILQTLCSKTNPDDNSLSVMASLLRFLDSCDFNRNRVGSPSMIKLRERVCNDNASAQIEKFSGQLKSCHENLQKKFRPTDRGMNKYYGANIASLKEMVTMKYIPDKMEDERLSILRKLKGLLDAPEQQKEIDKTLSFGNYIGLLKQQVKHYEVHNSIISVSFKREPGDNSIHIEYKVDNEVFSKNKEIKTSADAEKVIKEFISKKTKVVYDEILKNNLLNISNVVFNDGYKDFDDWIRIENKSEVSSEKRR